MSVARLSVWWLISLLVLIILNAFMVQPMITFAESSTNTTLTGVNGTTIQTAGGCVTSGGSQSIDDIFDAVSVVSGSLINLVINSILGFLGFGVTNQDGQVCLGSVDILGGSSLIFAASGLLLTVGVGVLLAGFLTAGASRGGIATFGYALIIGGAMGAGLALVQGVFDTLPGIGTALFALYAGVGFILVMHTGLSMLSGGE